MAVALLFAACAKETAPEKTGKKMVFKAGLAEVKSTASATGAFAWSEGDRIYAFDIWGMTRSFTLSKGAGTKNAEFTSDEEIDGVSGYAFAGAGDIYSWGGVYRYYLTSYYGDNEVGQTHSPMIATIPEGPNPSLAFRHLCGLIKVTLKGFTGTLSSVRLVSKDKSISGDFEIQNIGTENACIETMNSGDNEVNYSLYLNVDGDVDFYFPIPVGTYGGFTLYIEGQDKDYNKIDDTYEINKSVTIGRGELRTLERKVIARKELDNLNWMNNGDRFDSKEVIVRAVADDPSKGFVVSGVYGYPQIFVSGNAGTLKAGDHVFVGGTRAQTTMGYIYLAEGEATLLYMEKAYDYWATDITSSIDYYSAYNAEFVKVEGVVSTAGGKTVVKPAGAATGAEIYALGKGVSFTAATGETVTIEGYLVNKNEANFEVLVTNVYK